MNAGDPCRCLSRAQLVGIRKRNFAGSTRESDLLIVPFVSQGKYNFGKGKEKCFHRVSEEGNE
jgi:hypothetical protein